LKFIDDILKKPLWMNMLIGFGVVMCLFIIFFFSLGWITGNGETGKVPAVCWSSASPGVRGQRRRQIAGPSPGGRINQHESTHQC
jgi:hypothetical protein